MAESIGEYDDLAGSMDGHEDNMETQATENNRLLFDIMSSRLSANVHAVTSQHLAVGQHCISMLLGNG